MNIERQKLRLIEPPFSSPLTDLIIELDFLRKKRVEGTTHPRVFSQLKQIFHMLESIGSARIEGNNTTIAEYIETKIDGAEQIPVSIQEIQNMEKALGHIDSSGENLIVNRDFVSDLHKMVVENLPSPPDGEGDATPGFYGSVAVLPSV